jgi:hypothetical protein
MFIMKGINRMKKISMILIALNFLMMSFLCVPFSAHALMITNGDFSNWTFGATGSAIVTNKGSYIDVTTISGPVVYGTAIKSDFSTLLPIDNASFTLQLDVKSGPGDFGEGQAIMLLVEQDAGIYGKWLGDTYVHQDWDTLSFTGSLVENTFPLLMGSGPAYPNFTGNVETYFGFAGGNHISGVLTQYYKNFNLDIESVGNNLPVPESDTLLLFGAGIIGLIILRFGRKASSM